MARSSSEVAGAPEPGPAGAPESAGGPVAGPDPALTADHRSGDPDPQRAFAAMGEPTRYRILEVLAQNASTVGGVAEAIGALQPQTTKHLQALEAAGLITVHKLGRRRVAQLDRAAFAALSAHLGAWSRDDADDDALAAYAQGIAREDADPGRARALTLRTGVPASADAVWRAWTDPRQAARWWAPSHFEVRELEIAPESGAPIRFALGEPGGATYRSEGRVLEVEPCRRLVFALAPLDEAGQALFDAVYSVELDDEGASIASSGDGAATAVALRIDVDGVRAGAAEAVAGLEPGWTQLFSGLTALFAGGSAD
ncbi:metalloregulator ArsR/SmtB family transcription factor [Microbacterium xylanilyticum]